MKKKYIDYETYTKQLNLLNASYKKGLRLVFKKQYVRVILGLSCLIIALIPNGTGIILYPLSFYFLRISKKDLENYKRIFKNKLLRRL